MSFDALTLFGIFIGVLSGGLLIGLAAAGDTVDPQAPDRHQRPLNPPRLHQRRSLAGFGAGACPKEPAPRG